MTKRETALTLARIAGYHSNSKAFTRLVIESRVNREAMSRAWVDGVRRKANGTGCNCYECAQAARKALHE